MRDAKFAPTLLLGLLCAFGCESRLDDKPSAAVETKPATAQTEASANPPTEKPPLGEATTLLASPESKVEFVGSKLTMDQPGTFERFEAAGTLDATTLTTLSVTVETDSVVATKEKLTKHLKDPDFLETAAHPKATFVSESISARESDDGTHEIVGTLTIRGISKTLTFPATIEVSDESVHAKASFKFNRKHFGMEYDGMADDAIKDEVLLEIDLNFPR